MNNNIMSTLPWIGVIYLPLIIFPCSLAASVRQLDTSKRVMEAAHTHRKKIAVDPLLGSEHINKLS